MINYQDKRNSCGNHPPTAHRHLLEHHQPHLSKDYLGMKCNEDEHKDCVSLATNGSLRVINVKGLNFYFSRATTTPTRSLVKKLQRNYMEKKTKENNLGRYDIATIIIPLLTLEDKGPFP